MNKKAAYGIAAAAAIAAIAAVAAVNTEVSVDDGAMMMDDAPEGILDVDVIRIGALLPATGDIAAHGQDSNIAAQLAAEDFNSRHEADDSPYRVDLIVEDTQTDPVVALEKLSSLNSKGINLVVGTQTSAELNNIKSYADSNGLLLVSPSSTSPKLAIPGDNVYRLIPDDTKQSRVLSDLFVNDGLEVVIPIYRGDVWGDGLYEATRDAFVAAGGTFDEGIRYSPEATTFSPEASGLDEKVRGYLEDRQPGEVAVLVIGFSEVVHLFNFASSHDSLRQVHWYGSDGSSNDDAITGDRIASEFARDVRLVTTQFAASDSPVLRHVTDHMMERTGSLPNAYAYSAYDAVMLLANAAVMADSDDAEDIKEVLGEVAAEYDGAVGRITFNESGDLGGSDYALWAVDDGGQWYVYGQYSASDGSFAFTDG